VHVVVVLSALVAGECEEQRRAGVVRVVLRDFSTHMGFFDRFLPIGRKVVIRELISLLTGVQVGDKSVV
jgi:hypothetical protein